jgi:uncharacterized membrane protein (UPF0127 family)
LKAFYPADPRPKRSLSTIFPKSGLFLVGLLFLCGSCNSKTETTLSLVWLEVGGKKIQVEVADTPPTQQMGLMFRKRLGKDQGMVFVFERPAQRSFWMKNTLIPLSIAYMDGKGTILNILDMRPRDLSSYLSAGPAQYALEMNQGWFVRHGVKPGDKVQGLPDLSTPRP